MFGLGHPFGQQKYLPPLAGVLPHSKKGSAATLIFHKKLVRGNLTKQTLTSECDEAIDGQPDYLDILMGRAKNSQKHSGNLIFQKLILANIKTYTRNSRGGKGHVVKSLLTFLRDKKKVRFLKKLDCGSYVQILDTKVLNDKVSHALRDVQFSDESQYCPPEAEDIVKEFQAYSLAQENEPETRSAEMKVNTSTGIDEEIRNAINSDLSTVGRKRTTERDRKKDTDDHVAHQSVLKKENDTREDIVSPFNYRKAIDNTPMEQQAKAVANLVKLTRHHQVDPDEISPTRESLLQQFNHRHSSHPLFPIMTGPIPSSHIMTNKSLLTKNDQFRLEEIRRAHTQLEQLRAQGRAHSQFEQLLAHDQIQMEQLRAAQEARRNRLLLSRGTDPLQSLVTRQPLSSASSFSWAPTSAVLTTVSQPITEEINSPLSGIELLSNVVDVLTMGPPPTHMDEVIPSQVFSSQSQATLNIAYTTPIKDNLAIFGALQSSCQTPCTLQRGSKLALSQWTSGLNPVVIDQLALGYGPGDPKKRRIGEYPFLSNLS